ncbi:transglutaminase-like enzyme, predicted cysteine protease [Saccharomonospora xinjiangensis XJ-54]|uniref:Transglutaminase-like enzyme, predicted cysteine protease n=1 Tax=Saccharomonospora xinjiangensis XJ-54 TaxID=882086 RepID=I0V6W6_9PSEU|nr:transglutaminase-like enzyme, predicted cysteine protease [Saccharomonospora xinjiangensis XJ-54]
MAPAAAMFATISAATSLTGVVRGGVWLAFVAVAALLVAFTGLALRALRVPTPLVGLGQAVVLLFLITGSFTNSGILAIIPGPAAFAELDEVLTAAFGTIRTGVPPVEATAPILCLATIAIGLVAIVVDTLVVAATAPAAAGLVLLCVYAVPSALADNLLPWWTFVLGATAFAILLAVDGSHRHNRWRNRPALSGGVPAAARPTPVAVVAGALAAGLVTGTAITGIGTEGSLPGSKGERIVLGGLGVNPFTSLRGMLDQGEDVPLFRVSGLDEPRLLRAFTLDTYRPNEGWGLAEGPIPAGVPANGPLPSGHGDDGSAPDRRITIEPVHWNDVWLPVYGSPRALEGVSEGWYYDRTSGSVFRERRQTPGPYVETAALTEPTKADLRGVEPDPTEIDDVYTQVSYVDQRVARLAERLAASSETTFDKVHAIWEYFDVENGFVYDTRTAPAADGDALADFVLQGKRGYCEQYASAMAVMLRSLDIPARVAIGFTGGTPDGDVRTITSRDAHAWVEVYFGEHGWVGFDPTPLADGRGYLPPYLTEEPDQGGDTANGDEVPSTRPNDSPDQSEPTRDQQKPGDVAAQQPQDGSLSDRDTWLLLIAAILAAAAVTVAVFAVVSARRSRPSGSTTPAGRAAWLPLEAAGLGSLAAVLLGWWVHWAVALALLVCAGLLLAPAVVRQAQRHRRLNIVEHGSDVAAADAAWRELRQECGDRNLDITSSDTVRLAAQKIARKHRLDDRGKQDLRVLVTMMEQSWYGSARERSDRDAAGFARAFLGVLGALDRAEPLSWKGRLLPRSVVRRTRSR